MELGAEPLEPSDFGGPISEIVEVTDADVVELDVHALLTRRTDSFLDELAPEARAVLLRAREPVAAWPDAPRVLGAVAKPLPSV